MAKNALTPGSKKILNLVQEFGCISLQQINYLFRGTNPKSISFFVMALYKMQYVVFSKDNEYIMLPHLKSPDTGKINAIWILLMNLSKEEMEESGMYYSADAPVDACFFKDGDVFQIMYISKYNMQAMDFFVEKEKSKMLNKDEVDSYKYILTVTEPEIIDRIAKANPELNYNIAYLDFTKGQNGVPEVSYYNPRA